MIPRCAIFSDLWNQDLSPHQWHQICLKWRWVLQEMTTLLASHQGHPASDCLTSDSLLEIFWIPLMMQTCTGTTDPGLLSSGEDFSIPLPSVKVEMHMFPCLPFLSGGFISLSATLLVREPQLRAWGLLLDLPLWAFYCFGSQNNDASYIWWKYSFLYLMKKVCYKYYMISEVPQYVNRKGGKVLKNCFHGIALS